MQLRDAVGNAHAIDDARRRISAVVNSVDALADQASGVRQRLTQGHAVERAHIRSGDKVLVVGAGPVGLSVLAWAARTGASELVASDPSAAVRSSVSGSTTCGSPTR